MPLLDFGRNVEEDERRGVARIRVGGGGLICAVCLSLVQ